MWRALPSAVRRAAAASPPNSPACLAPSTSPWMSSRRWARSPVAATWPPPSACRASSVSRSALWRSRFPARSRSPAAASSSTGTPTTTRRSITARASACWW